MSFDQFAPRPFKRTSILVGLPKAFLASVCLAILAWAFLNDRLAVTPGLEWFSRIRLRMEFNSFPFMLLFVPSAFVLYALARGTRAANWVLVLASLGIYATVGAIYLIPLLFTSLFDYVTGAFLSRSPNGRIRTAVFVVSVAIQLTLLYTFKIG